MKFASAFFTILFVISAAASCGGASKKSDTPKSAREILEKTYKKYSKLVEKDGDGIHSLEAKISIKGAAEIPTPGSSTMPLDVDLMLELFVKNPQKVYLDVSGNIGSARLIVPGNDNKDKKSRGALMLPNTKQFAYFDVPDKVMEKIEEPKPEQKEEAKQERDIWENAILEYDGTQNMKAGKAHKIIIKSKDPSEKNHVIAYILDGKWDPVRLEVVGESGNSALVIDFEKLVPNARIPDSKFVLDPQGYTEVTQQQISTLVMMQIMASMMQKEKQQ